MDNYLPEWKIRYATRLYSKVAQVPPTEDNYPPANNFYRESRIVYLKVLFL
jgi:hypothetical protein